MAKKSFINRAKGSLAQSAPVLSSEDQGVRRDVAVGTDQADDARIIPIDKIDFDQNQPRDEIDEDSQEFKDFVTSIAKDGLIQAITVEYVPQSKRYLLIAGERRLRAVKKLNWDKIPCFVKENVKASDRYALQLSENIQRLDLNPVQKARGLINLKKLLEQETGTKVPWRAVEERAGISEERRKNFMNLLKLPEQIQKTIVTTGHRAAVNGQITEKHGRALLRLKGAPDKQLMLFEKIRKSSQPISGDRAIEIAQAMIEPHQREVRRHKRFIIEYTSTKDLLKKLENEIKKIKAELKGGGA